MSRIKESDSLFRRVGDALDGAKPGTPRGRASDAFESWRMVSTLQLGQLIASKMQQADLQLREHDSSHIDGFTLSEWLEIIPSVGNSDDAPGATPEEDLETAEMMVMAAAGVNRDNLISGQADAVELLLATLIVSLGVREICAAAVAA